MSEPTVVVVDGGAAEPAGSSDFAAGVATAAAAVANEKADEALNAAEGATAGVDVAINIAGEAQSSAIAAEIEVEDLADKVDHLETMIVDLAGVLSDNMAGETASEGPGDDGAPPVKETVTVTHERTPAAPRSRLKASSGRKAFANSPFFRGRKQ